MGWLTIVRSAATSMPEQAPTLNLFVHSMSASSAVPNGYPMFNGC